MGIRVFRKDCSCVTRQIGDETIIVPIRANAADLTAVYTLNESASFVWQCIDGQRSVAQLVDVLFSEYEVALPEGEQDVMTLVGGLESAGLIQLTNPERKGPT
ncbi:MAG: hypothetical protein H6Q55_150 [Deltaproteobacteria bacterium]|nr:hypothetical protein [Deltaproteobacteria bacterium]